MKWLALLALSTILTSTTTVAETTNRYWATIAELEFPRATPTAFRETRSSKLLRKPAQQTGILWIEQGGDFVMQVLKPRPEERRLSNQRLQLTRGKKQRSLFLDRNKATHQLLLSIVAVLEGDVEQLQAAFEINSQATDDSAVADGWAVELTPIDPSLRKSLQRLVLRGSANSLLSLRAERPGNRWQEITILPPATSNHTQRSSD